MKAIKFKFLTIAAGTLLLTVSSCKKLDDFGDTNENPNAPKVPVPSALLTNVLSTIGSNVWGNAIAQTAALYCQYSSETQYTDASRYVDPNLGWDGYYGGSMYDLQSIIDYNNNPETKDIAQLYGSNANQIATARILLDYFYMIMTDTYGDLPYTGALKNNATPAYDKQQDVYPALINDLKAAVAQFDAGAVFQGDIVYSGSTAKWKRFANSLRAILALRMSKVNPTLAKSEFEAAITAGVITANADNFTITYPGGNFRNPVNNYYVQIQRFDYAVSKTLTDKLSALADPRLSKFASSAKGFPYGLTRDDALLWADANADYANLLAYTSTPQTFPFHVISAGQIWLARAAAANLGWNAGEVVGICYTNGITQSMEQWGVTGAAVTTYLAQASVMLNGTNDLQKIAEQRWLAHYPDGNQGWAEWRRTSTTANPNGWPALTPAPGSGKPIPRRMPYGPNDILYNPTNWEPAATGYTVGGVKDSQDGRVWWDKP
jgi:hypothetical protein